jgi:hypothetical protein
LLSVISSHLMNCATPGVASVGQHEPFDARARIAAQ